MIPTYPVTLKYSQGHQIWYELLDPKQGYHHEKFERPPLIKCVCKKPNVEVFVKSENM